MGMRMYKGDKGYWGTYEIAIVDVEGRGIGFNHNYKLVVLLNGNRTAYPIYYGTTLAPSYVSEKFNLPEKTGEAQEFVKFLQSLPVGELDISWYPEEEVRASEWEIRRIGTSQIVGRYNDIADIYNRMFKEE